MAFLVGLTGGIASGKSTVAQIWRELGAVEIDSDQLARDAVAPGTVGAKMVAETFGDQLFDASGNLDRAALAQIIFSDSSAKAQLESIVHPLISAMASQKIATSRGVVVYTIPLLVETNAQYPFDLVVTVSAEDETRVNRLINSRGLSREQAVSRLSSQATNQQREKIADIVIDSECSLDELKLRAKQVWQQVLEISRAKSS